CCIEGSPLSVSGASVEISGTAVVSGAPILPGSGGICVTSFVGIPGVDGNVSGVDRGTFGVTSDRLGVGDIPCCIISGVAAAVGVFSSFISGIGGVTSGCG